MLFKVNVIYRFCACYLVIVAGAKRNGNYGNYGGYDDSLGLQPQPDFTLPQNKISREKAGVAAMEKFSKFLALKRVCNGSGSIH